jgi:hypothetical protein
VWFGVIQGPEHYKAKYGVDQVAYVDEMAQVLKDLNPAVLHLLAGINTDRWGGGEQGQGGRGRCYRARRLGRRNTTGHGTMSHTGSEMWRREGEGGEVGLGRERRGRGRIGGDEHIQGGWELGLLDRMKEWLVGDVGEEG